MHYPILRTLFILPLMILLLSGCVSKQPYDYTALKKNHPKSILVLPPMNDTVEVNAPYIYLATISRPLAEKGYYVFPVSVVDNLMKENGVTFPAEMHAIPLEKIVEHIGADAVLYVSITEWGQKYQLLSSKSIVRAKVRLVDSRTGELLWDSEVSAEQSSDNSNSGVLGMLVGALVEQIAGSIMDNTFALSSVANVVSINDKQRGLLNGPYSKKEITNNSKALD